MEIATIKYGERLFKTQAKEMISNNSEFTVLVSGWHAKIIQSTLPILMHMQSSNSSEDKDKFTTVFTITCFIKLILLPNFMIVFWIAVANDYQIDLLENIEGLIELTFSRKNDPEVASP